MQVIAVLSMLAVLLITTYAGYRAGCFDTLYLLVRSVFAFLLAMTLFEPLTALMERIVSWSYPGPFYYNVIFFILVFSATSIAAGWARERFMREDVPCFRWLDRIGGPVLGLAHGVVLAGTLLILWTMMPFAKYLPGDFGRVRTEQLGMLNMGKLMLRFYAHVSEAIPGGRPFVLEASQQGAEQESWLWLYRHHADFTSADLARIWGRAGPGAEEALKVRIGRTTLIAGSEFTISRRGDTVAYKFIGQGELPEAVLVTYGRVAAGPSASDNPWYAWVVSDETLGLEGTVRFPWNRIEQGTRRAMIREAATFVLERKQAKELTGAMLSIAALSNLVVHR